MSTGDTWKIYERSSKFIRGPPTEGTLLYLFLLLWISFKPLNNFGLGSGFRNLADWNYRPQVTTTPGMALIQPQVVLEACPIVAFPSWQTAENQCACLNSRGTKKVAGTHAVCHGRFCSRRKHLENLQKSYCQLPLARMTLGSSCVENISP